MGHDDSRIIRLCCLLDPDTLYVLRKWCNNFVFRRYRLFRPRMTATCSFNALTFETNVREGLYDDVGKRYNSTFIF